MAAQLNALTLDHGFSIKAGELQVIDGGWYVTHTGLLRLARRKKCRGIHVEAVDTLCDSAANRYVLKPTVYPSKESAGIVGYGDADPSNVSALVSGAEMRIAETRAVNRALRKAYGIGICSVDELGSRSSAIAATANAPKIPPSGTKGNSNGRGHKGAISCVRSSASTSSIPNWSKPMPSTSVVPRPSKMPLGTGSKPLSSSCRRERRRTPLQVTSLAV